MCKPAQGHTANKSQSLDFNSSLRDFRVRQYSPGNVSGVGKLRVTQIAALREGAIKAERQMRERKGRWGRGGRVVQCQAQELGLVPMDKRVPLQGWVQGRRLMEGVEGN